MATPRAWVLVLFVVLASVSGVASAQPAPKFATVTTETCSIRAAADEASAAVTSAKRGTVLQVEAVQGAWIKVRTEAGETGFVKKTDLSPGKKTLAELPPLPGATPAATPKVAVAPTPTPTPRAAATPKTATPAATSTPAPAVAAAATPPVAAAQGSERESRTGLAVHAGPIVATSSYRLTGGDSAHREGTRYYGFAADVDYWLLESLGGHLRVATARGTMSSRVSPSTEVSGIGAEIRQIQLDLLGRYVIGSSPTAPSVHGGIGFHMHQFVVESVKIDGNSVGPVSQSYLAPVLGVGGDLPLGSPTTGVRGRVEYWLAASVSEPGSASGKPDGASGTGVVFGGYTRVTGKVQVEATVEHQSFAARFKGDGFRFNEPVRNARSTDRYTVFTVSGAYRF